MGTSPVQGVATTADVGPFGAAETINDGQVGGAETAGVKRHLELHCPWENTFCSFLTVLAEKTADSMGSHCGW